MGRRRKYKDDATARVAGIWHGMVRRCHNESDPSYSKYGGRGISVCERWRLNVFAFIDDMGAPPTNRHSIDRIDNDGNYEPGNCRWATQKEQCLNKRNTLRVRYRGKDMLVDEFADKMGFEKQSVRAYLCFKKLTASQIIHEETQKRRRAIALKERRAEEARRKGRTPSGRTYKHGKCGVCGRRWHYAPTASDACPHESRHVEFGRAEGPLQAGESYFWS